MPSLQLDLPFELDASQKYLLAAALTDDYSRIMGSDPALMTVVIRTLSEGSVWHGSTAGGLTPGALVMADVRAGRDRQTRHELAATLVELVGRTVGMPIGDIKVEFTQHTGDEMFHPALGGFNRDWDASERTAQ